MTKCEFELSTRVLEKYFEVSLMPTLENKLNGKLKIINGNYFIITNEKKYLITHPFWSEIILIRLKRYFSQNRRIKCYGRNN